MTFTLTIELGNDAMQDYVDIASALTKLSERLSDVGGAAKYDGGGVMDLNGNSVGSWEVR